MPGSGDLSAEPEAPESLAGGSLLLLTAQLIGNSGFFVAVLILARGLTLAERGAVAFLTVTAIVTARIVDAGVPQATTIFAAREYEHRPALLTNLVLFTLGTAAAGGGLVALGLAALPGVRPAGIHSGELLALAAGVVAVSLVDSGLQFLLGLGRFREQTVLRAVVPWLYALLLAGAWAAGSLSVLWAIVSWTLAHTVGGVLLTAVAARRTGFGRFRWEHLRELVVFGVRAWAGTLTRVLNFRVDQVLMGFISSEAQLGIYSVAVNLSEVLLYLPAAVGNAMLPAVTRAPKSERSASSLKVFRVVTLVTAITIAVAALIGAPLLPVIFGHKFHGSVAPFLWLLPGALGYAASVVFSSALLADEEPTLSSLGSSVSLLVGFGLDLALIPPYGPVGAAIAASAAFVVGGAAATLGYQRKAHFHSRELLPSRAELAELMALRRRLPLSGVRELPVEPPS